MSSESKMTTDHKTIQTWVEKRGGVPAIVKGTEHDTGYPGVLRIHYPENSSDEDLEPISWNDFFQKFENSHLAFVYQEKTQDGEVSRFSKIVDRNDEEARQA